MTQPNPARVTVYRDEGGRWRWHAQARNNRVIGASEQGYTRRWYAARKARKAFPDAEILVKSPPKVG